MSRLIPRVALLAAALWLVAFARAEAQTPSCSFSVSNLNFGAVSATGGVVDQTDSTASFQANCSGTAGTTVRVCLNLPAGSGGAAPGGDPRTMLSGSDQLAWNVYTDVLRTTVWGDALAGGSVPALDFTIAANGRGNNNRILYGRVAGGQAATAGAFASLLTGSVRFAVGAGSACSAISTNASSVVLAASATYQATCSMSVGILDFGALTSLTGFRDSTGSIFVSCTSGTAYTVSLGNGLTGTDPAQRKMTLGSNELLYGLFRDSGRSQVWGATAGTNTLPGSGSGSSQTLTVYGRVPAQSLPPVGTYRDTVVVTLSY